MVFLKHAMSPVVLSQTILKTLVNGEADTSWGREEAAWCLVSQGATGGIDKKQGSQNPREWMGQLRDDRGEQEKPGSQGEGDDDRDSTGECF